MTPRLGDRIVTSTGDGIGLNSGFIIFWGSGRIFSPSAAALSLRCHLTGAEAAAAFLVKLCCLSNTVAGLSLGGVAPRSKCTLSLKGVAGGGKSSLLLSEPRRSVRGRPRTEPGRDSRPTLALASSAAFSNFFILSPTPFDSSHFSTLSFCEHCAFSTAVSLLVSVLSIGLSMTLVARESFSTRAGPSLPTGDSRQGARGVPELSSFLVPEPGAFTSVAGGEVTSFRGGVALLEGGEATTLIGGVRSPAGDALIGGDFTGGDFTGGDFIGGDLIGGDFRGGDFIGEGARRGGEGGRSLTGGVGSEFGIVAAVMEDFRGGISAGRLAVGASTRAFCASMSRLRKEELRT